LNTKARFEIVIIQDQFSSWIWRVPDVTAEGEVTLVRWRVIEVPDGERFLVGYCLERGEGRVSTSLLSVDVSRMVCHTASGRVYQLEGQPGVDPDGDFIWRAAMRARKVESWNDLSGDIWKLRHSHAATAQDKQGSS
jgi:hypothetical protein